ncbi:MAG: nickel pincer cofactor biosynthesis protein LarC, partial [Firmicutes bacterium]|nr:nickel pincer cofactor biosynthesis protein LarC [Bacillota bacterium]
GDMLMAALSELAGGADGFGEKMNALGIPNVKFEKQTAVKCGIRGTRIAVKVGGEEESEHARHHHSHTTLRDIEGVVSRLEIPDKVRRDILAVYRLIAEAESAAHGCSVEEIHFHEVGAMDAVADITGVCMLINELAPDKIIASPVNVGGGTVRCAHGILPVPAPAAEYLLRGIPTYGGGIMSELCTPTGAALLKYFVAEFGGRPLMSALYTGYGMGTKDFETANCLRATLGETADTSDSVFEICCNIDDMTAEELAFAAERIFDAGALDVFTTPIHMKKNRSAQLLTVICGADKKESVIEAVYKHTSTIGIRAHICGRCVMSRAECVEETSLGTVKIKRSEGYGAKRVKAEYDDIARIAAENGITLSEARRRVFEEIKK